MPLAKIEGRDIRPTLDRVRESVFNILTPDLDDDAVFLDLFSGTGANGLEALSRGVKKAILIDSSAESLRIIRQNAVKLKVERDCTILRGSLPEKLAFLTKQGSLCSVIYCDPPFDYPDYDALLVSIGFAGILTPAGVFVLEHEAKREMPAEAGELKRYRAQSYGHTGVSFYRLTDKTGA